MLSTQDNELLCRVGPGTPMGEFMREYWLPAFVPSELPEADGEPRRMRLLGENLIAFRVSSGKYGLIANHCPHRGASLFFGRNEEEGIRCVYHGWKFSVDGSCVDMPNEPVESDFRTKVRATTYPCVERNGIVWTYMGPRETPPPLPDWLPNLEPDCQVWMRLQESNWLQALEGDIDTVHAFFLHSGHIKTEKSLPGSDAYYITQQRHGRFVAQEHAIGAGYVRRDPLGKHDPYGPRNASGVQPRKFITTSDWLGRYRPIANQDNDYLIDRDLQKSMGTYTGIPGMAQDQMAQATMGPIYD